MKKPSHLAARRLLNPWREWGLRLNDILGSMLSQLPTGTPAKLRAFLAKKRFRPYAAVFKGDEIQAAKLYALNVELSGALLELLHFAEIGLRERMHSELTGAYGRYWFFDQGQVLDSRSTKKVAEATRYFGKHPEPGRVVAEFNLGFWRELYTEGGQIRDKSGLFVRNADYETDLWDPALKNVFATGGRGNYSMKDAERLARRVQRARNRVSHHESIVFGITQPGERTATGLQYRQSPHSMMADIRELLSIVCDGEMSIWLDACQHADELIKDTLAHDALDHALKNLKDIEWL